MFLPTKRFAGRFSQYTYAIFIQSYTNTDGLQLLRLYIYRTSHINTALMVKQLFQTSLFFCDSGEQQPQCKRTQQVKKTVCTSFKLNSAWLRASSVGRSSSLNDRDCGLISVCVVSRWFQQKLHPEKKLGCGIWRDQQVVGVTVTTPPLQSQGRNSHIPRPFMHVHFYVCAGKHEVTLTLVLCGARVCFEVSDQTF